MIHASFTPAYSLLVCMISLLTRLELLLMRWLIFML